MNEAQQAHLKAAVQASPRAACTEAGDWTWKVVRTFGRERFGIPLCRSSRLNYLHRLGFVVRRPKKRLLKADEAKRAVPVISPQVPRWYWSRRMIGGACPALLRRGDPARAAAPD